MDLASPPLGRINSQVACSRFCDQNLMTKPPISHSVLGRFSINSSQNPVLAGSLLRHISHLLFCSNSNLVPTARPKKDTGSNPVPKIATTVWAISQHSQGDVIFQKSDPPEAAPLLAPCLKIAQKVREFIQRF